MFESKDSGFTLFGTRIPPMSHSHGLSLNSKTFLDCSSEVAKVEGEGTRIRDCAKVDHGENQTAMMASEAQTNSSPKDDQAESSCTEQERSFKKPDKIIPCPRCNSLDTKFCYFNNYNVHQPRHFCKNCQRYWTAGGTMRNVPVGAGRRKNKHLASQYRQILVSSDGIPTARIESPNTANHSLISCSQSENAFRPSTGNGTVLKFGPDASLCESRETVLNVRDQKSCVDMQGLVSFVRNGEEPSSCVSSMTTACSNPESELPSKIIPEQVDFPGSRNEFYTPHPMHCYPATPWIMPCNPDWNGVASTAAAAQYPSKQVQFFPTPMMAVPGFGPPSFPLQFIPAPYWGCMPLWSSTGTGMPSLTRSAGGLSPSSSTSNSCCSGNGSPTLGKHGRDTNLMDEKKPEKCIVVPKTLRVDDPNEASRSPIWVSLGIKQGQSDSVRKDTIFRAFESKAADSKGHVLDGTLVLEANPAALSRSQTFNESS